MIDKNTSHETTEETFKVTGEKVIEKIKELINEGNIRHITVSDKHGKVIVEFPVTLGVGVAVIAPALAVVGAAVALLTECTITVKKTA
jgi:aryl-alcohol dehydrogenase-like predicted oxidoreductase